MTELEVIKPASLARYALEVEQICDEIDAIETDEIPPEIIAKFARSTQDLALKTDNWIGLLEAVKFRIELLKEQKDRVSKALKTADKFQARLKEYLVQILKTFPDTPFKGNAGRICLQKNPDSVRIDFETKDVTVYGAIDKALIDLEPSLNPYIKEITVYTLDKAQVKAALKSGATLPWARLDAGSHVRVRQ